MRKKITFIIFCSIAILTPIFAFIFITKENLNEVEISIWSLITISFTFISGLLAIRSVDKE